MHMLSNVLTSDVDVLVFCIDESLMSLKTHLIFNPFFLVYYKIIVDSYAETWVIYSNLILQKNTT